MTETSDMAGLTCMRCGYDLSGSSKDGACPECAHPVWRSLDRTHVAADRQLERLASRWRTLALLTEALGWLYGAGVLVVPLMSLAHQPQPGSLWAIPFLIVSATIVVGTLSAGFVWWVFWFRQSGPTIRALWPALAGPASRVRLLLFLGTVGRLFLLVSFFSNAPAAQFFWLRVIDALLTWLFLASQLAFAQCWARSVRSPRSFDGLLMWNGVMLVGAVIFAAWHRAGAEVSIQPVAVHIAGEGDDIASSETKRSSEEVRALIQGIASAAFLVAFGRRMRLLHRSLPASYREYQAIASPPAPAVQ